MSDRQARNADRREAVADAYVQRLLATAPPLTDERKLRLSRLLTPPSRAHAQIATLPTRAAPTASVLGDCPARGNEDTTASSNDGRSAR